MSETPAWLTELRAAQALLAELESKGLVLRLDEAGEPRAGPLQLLDPETLAVIRNNRLGLVLALRWRLPT